MHSISKLTSNGQSRPTTETALPAASNCLHTFHTHCIAILQDTLVYMGLCFIKFDNMLLWLMQVRSTQRRPVRALCDA